MVNVPNLLTFLRIAAVPLFLSLLAEGKHQAALVVFVAAGLTDGIDGFIARLYNLRTEIGAHLDPLADKLLVISSFIALGLKGAVPLPLMIIVLTRDAVILGGYLMTAAVVGKPMEMAPSLWGKLTTFTQLLSVALVLLRLAEWWVMPPWLLLWVFVATAVASFVSGTGYVVRGLRYYQDNVGESAS